MAEHEKIIPEYPALDFNFGNYGQGTDYTKDSQRMRDLYYGTNTNPDIRSFSNPDDVVPILQQYGKDFGKAAGSAAQMTLDLPSMVSYAGGLLGYGADYLMGGIEKGEGEKDYYDYVPHYEVDLARGRTPYQNMLIKPYGTIAKKGVETGIQAGQILFNDGFTQENLQRVSELNPWLSPDVLKASGMKVRGAPDPSSIKNTAEFGFMGLLSGTGYFAKIPLLAKLAMNKKYVANGALWGASNSLVKELNPEWDGTNADSIQTFAMVGMNLVTDLMLRRTTASRDNFIKMGLNRDEAILLDKELPKIEQIIKQSKNKDMTPLEQWQLISKLDMPGMQAYMRLLIQAEPRFKSIIAKQHGELISEIDKVLTSPILLGKNKLAFNNNLDAYASADDIIMKYDKNNRIMNETFRNDIGKKRLSQDFSVNEKEMIQNSIDAFKQSKDYTQLSTRLKQEMDTFLNGIVNNKNMDSLDNALRERYDIYRHLEDGGKGNPVDKSFKNSHMNLKNRISNTLEEFVDANGNKTYQIAKENYVKSANKFLTSTPAYKSVQNIERAASKGDADAVIDQSIMAMYNPRLTNRQVDEVLTILDDIGGETLVPDLLRIRIQETAKKVFKEDQTSAQRVQKFTDSVYGNLGDTNVYKQIVKHIIGNKNLKDNESAQIVLALHDWFSTASRIPKVGSESMTGLYQQFLKDVGGGVVDDLNPLRWSEKIRQRYVDYNIGKMADLFTDKYFLQKLYDLKINDKKDKGFIHRFITGAIIGGSYKLGGYGQLAQDEYRTNQYKQDKSNALYKENKKTFKKNGGAYQ